MFFSALFMLQSLALDADFALFKLNVLIILKG